MSAWSYPEVILIAVVVAALGSFWLMRAAAGGGNRKPDFECDVCGRKQTSLFAKEWRYCPYCGAPRAAKGTHELPKRARPDV